MTQEAQSALDNLTNRSNRANTVIEKKIDQFVEAQQSMEEQRNLLTLEVEEFKALRLKFLSVMEGAMKENINRALPQFVSALVKEIEEKSKAALDTHTEKAQRINKMTEEVIQKANRCFKTLKREMTLRRFGMILCFCLGSFLTGCGLFYFFPQQITFGMNGNTAKHAMLGEALIESADKLTVGQKAYFNQKLEEKMKQWVAHRK